ncbi:MAG: hypothetical protein SFV21_09815 [Rhodospirillaceae bacterium]|nr:hypothetical protein [Rhodospirillaceae bacterium]
MNAVSFALRNDIAQTCAGDGEMDALHILPLRLLPFKNDKIGRARMIKNNQLTGVLEVYASRETGSGQVPIDRLPEYYNIANPLSDPDMQILMKLGPLPSYDVYSLRRSLRGLGIQVNQHDALKLSDDMNRALAGYMTRFTVPLLQQVYGDDAADIQRFEDLVGMFRDPDPRKALARLRVMAEKLDIAVEQIPKFLEDYGDIFLSLSYYQHCLDQLKPMLDGFVVGMNDMRSYQKVKSNPRLMTELERLEKTIAGLVTFLKRMFQDFAVRSRDMWDNLSAAKFRHVKEVIEGAQTTVGGVLCGLTVKMNAWNQRFPNPKVGGPSAREEFLLSEFKPGLASVIAIARGQGDVVGLA